MAQPPPGPVSPAPTAPVAPPGRSIRVSLPAVVIGIAMIGSILFIGYVVMAVDDGQIPMLAAGVVVLGASFAAIAIWSLVGMWQAASRAAVGRATGLAILGGLAGIGAIGCFTVAALAALVWNT